MKVKNNIIIVVSILIAVFIGEYYVSLSARNIVFMDFWRNINSLIEPVMNGKLSLNDVFLASSGQRNPLSMILLVLDIKYFNLNCIWEAYAGILVIAVTTSVVFCNFRDLLPDYKSSSGSFRYQLLFVPVVLTFFNLNQWEILSLQFSFAFMIRICAYVLQMSMLNHIINKSSDDNKKFFFTGVYFGSIILLLSQLYWPALVILNVIIWIHWIITRKPDMAAQKIVLFWLPVIIAAILYFYKIDMGTTGDNEFFNWITNGTFFVAILYMLAGSIFPQSKLEIIEKTDICILGIILLLIVIFAICLYFKMHMFKTTYFPIMLIGYGLTSIPIIIYGRASFGNVFYLTASRYSVETTLIWTGVFIIFAYALIRAADTAKHLFVRKGLLLFFIIVLASFFVYADYTELKIAPYRGSAKDELLLVIKNADEEDDEKLAGLQANNPEQVRTGILLMKKYSLNVFSSVNDK